MATNIAHGFQIDTLILPEYQTRKLKQYTSQNAIKFNV